MTSRTIIWYILRKSSSYNSGLTFSRARCRGRKGLGMAISHLPTSNKALYFDAGELLSDLTLGMRAFF